MPRHKKGHAAKLSDAVPHLRDYNARQMARYGWWGEPVTPGELEGRFGPWELLEIRRKKKEKKDKDDNRT